MTPDNFTFVQVIKACPCLGAFQDMVGLFINSSFKVVGMSLWAVAWLTCMWNVGALRILQECSIRCHLKLRSGCATSLCYFSGGAEYMCQRDCPWRGHVCSSPHCSNWFGVRCLWGTSLVGMYAKCGSIEDAWRVFNKLPSQVVVTWTAMILGHMRCGQEQKPLEVSRQMQQEGVKPNSVTFVGVLFTLISLGHYTNFSLPNITQI